MLDRRRLMPVAAIIAAAFALCLASLALAARADAYVYWTNTDTIGRANLDGTDVNQSFITGAGDLRGVAVDAEHVYWANGDTDTIGRANLDGTDVNQSFVTGASNPVGVAVDAEHVYWANVHLTAGGGSIGRADLDGTDTDQSFVGAPTDNGTVMGGVTVNANHIYWTDFGRIGRADLDGSDGGFITDAFVGATTGLAVDSNHLYWSSDYRIARADLDGSNANLDFITGAFSTDGVAVDAGHVYWTNSLPGTPANGIGRANLDGTDVNQSFIAGASNPFGIAVDTLPKPTPPDTTPPKTTITKGAPKKTDKTKVKFKFTSSEPDSTFECRLDKKKFKPCTSPRKVKSLDEGKHKFKVRAIDAAGNIDPSAAKDKFKVVG